MQLPVSTEAKTESGEKSLPQLGEQAGEGKAAEIE
jgi:hypothetical protein